MWLLVPSITLSGAKSYFEFYGVRLLFLKENLRIQSLGLLNILCGGSSGHDHFHRLHLDATQVHYQFFTINVSWN